MPKPVRKDGESFDDYFGRLVAHYIKTGRERDQAVAIAASVTGTSKKKRKKK